MTAVRYDLSIEQGETFELHLIWKDSDNVPIAITGYTLHMQIRESVERDDVLLDINSANVVDGISFNTFDATGEIDVEVSDEITAALTFSQGEYDLFMYSPAGKSYKLMYGNVRLVDAVTRGMNADGMLRLSGTVTP